MSKEITKERRELIELINDIARRLRNGSGRSEIITMLETAFEEAAKL